MDHKDAATSGSSTGRKAENLRNRVNPSADSSLTLTQFASIENEEKPQVSASSLLSRLWGSKRKDAGNGGSARDGAAEALTIHEGTEWSTSTKSATRSDSPSSIEKTPSAASTPRLSPSLGNQNSLLESGRSRSELSLETVGLLGRRDSAVNATRFFTRGSGGSGQTTPTDNENGTWTPVSSVTGASTRDSRTGTAMGPGGGGGGGGGAAGAGAAIQGGPYGRQYGETRTLSSVLRRVSGLLYDKPTSNNLRPYNDSDFKKYWMPDSNCNECYDCGNRFTTFRRRHHCRICGQIFCSSCCNQEVPGKFFGYEGSLRVCTYCCDVALQYVRTQSIGENVSTSRAAIRQEMQRKHQHDHAAALSVSPSRNDSSKTFTPGRRETMVGLSTSSDQAIAGQNLHSSGSSIDMSPSHRNVAHDTSTSVGRSTFFKSASSQDLPSLGNAEYDNGSHELGVDIFKGIMDPALL